MPPVRIAVLQMTSGINPAHNGEGVVSAIKEAAENGAVMIFTPEMTGFVDRNRARAAKIIRQEREDPVLQVARDAACRHGIWVHLGSLAILRDDGRWANRSFVIDQNGDIAARYDKIHMFDVNLENGESWRESSIYAPGDQVVTVETPIGRLGLAICYDMRFPALFAELSRQRCDVLALPSAFTVPTGRDHWHVLLRARAIESSAYVIASAQYGTHEGGRQTYGHSLVVDPWGKIIADAGEQAPAIIYADILPKRIAEARRQIPSLANRQEISRSSKP